MHSKSKILSLVLISVIALFITVSVRNAASTVAGGKHDLSWNGSANLKFDTLDVCVFCHTPHAANTNQTYNTNPVAGPFGSGGTQAGKLLWNRRLPSHAFTPYSSPTLNASPVISAASTPYSMLCLSCHDGIGAMNVLLNYADNNTQPLPVGAFTENQFGDFGTGDPNFGALNIGDAVCTGDNCASGGGNLQNDHPIGFLYNDASDTGLKPISGMSAALQRRMALTNNRMECSTCHDPHITNDGTDKKNMFLVVRNDGSALCFQCHNK